MQIPERRLRRLRGAASFCVPTVASGPRCTPGNSPLPLFHTCGIRRTHMYTAHMSAITINARPVVVHNIIHLSVPRRAPRRMLQLHRGLPFVHRQVCSMYTGTMRNDVVSYRVLIGNVGPDRSRCKHCRSALGVVVRCTTNGG